jgi:glycosyltransferase involved in cell wall biosynthesis
MDSLLAQDFADFTLLISDNASTDGTREIAQQYVAADSRVRYHRQSSNVGLYGNLDFLLRSVDSKYIKLASADDYWSPHMIGDAVRLLEREPSVCLCYPMMVKIEESGAELGKYDQRLQLLEDDPADRLQHFLTEVGLLNQLMGVIRVDTVRRTLPLLHHTLSDRIFVAELSLYGKIAQVDAYQYFRRFHERSSSYNRTTKAEMAQRTFPTGWHGTSKEAWMYHWALIRRVVHSPMSIGQKARALRFLVRGMIWDRRTLLEELTGVRARSVH